MVAAWTSLPELLDQDDDDTEPTVDLSPLAALMDRIEATRPAWQYEAACRGQDVRQWFPERGEPTRPAQAVCEQCSVAQACAAFAIAAGPALVGIWAGTTGRKRRQAAA